MTTVHNDTRPSLGFEGDTTEAARLAAKLARGRGARSNASGRYEALARQLVDDGWESLEELPPFKTTVIAEQPKTILTAQQLARHFLRSVDQSLSRLRAWLQLLLCAADPRLYGPVAGARFREQALRQARTPRELLRKRAAEPGYRPQTIALGANTDPYQPIERQYRVTRQILEVLAEFDHPVGIVTKSRWWRAIIDILSADGREGLVKVAVSVTTLDAKLARTMEPRAATPAQAAGSARLLAARRHSDRRHGGADHPGLNDSEIEKILAAAHAAGAREAGYVLLRLPLEVKDDLQRMADSAACPNGPRMCCR